MAPLPRFRPLVPPRRTPATDALRAEWLDPLTHAHRLATPGLPPATTCLVLLAEILRRASDTAPTPDGVVLRRLGAELADAADRLDDLAARRSAGALEALAVQLLRTTPDRMQLRDAALDLWAAIGIAPFSGRPVAAGPAA